MVLLWLHVPRLGTYTIVCLSTAGGLYILQKFLWISFVLYRNVGMGPQCRLTASHYTQPGAPSEVCQLRIDVKRGWKVKPGQFVYLSIPAIRGFGLGIMEAHPFMVAWTTDDESGRLKTIILIVQSHKGFTQRLKIAHGLPRAFIDGPYGGSDAETLDSYDKVLLLSSGIGIAAHLNTARHLLLAHNQQTARVRRLTIAWLLESQGTFSSYLHELGLTNNRSNEMGRRVSQRTRRPRSSRDPHNLYFLS
jgi:predicted ferric reductase